MRYSTSKRMGGCGRRVIQKATDFYHGLLTVAVVFRPAWGCTPAGPEVVDRFDSSAPAPVRPATALARTSRCPRSSGHLLPPHRRWLCSIGRRMPKRLRDTPCRTARKTGSRALPSLLRVALSVTSEHLLGLLGSSPIPPSLVTSGARLQLRPLSSTGVTRLPRYLRASPSPHTAQPDSHESPVDPPRSPLGLPVLRLVPVACMPSPLPRQDR